MYSTEIRMRKTNDFFGLLLFLHTFCFVLFTPILWDNPWYSKMCYLHIFLLLLLLQTLRRLLNNHVLLSCRLSYYYFFLNLAHIQEKRKEKEWSVPGKCNCRANCFCLCFVKKKIHRNNKAKLRLQFSVIVLSVTHLPIYCFSSLRPTINNTIIASDCCLFYELYVFIYIYIYMCDENGGESGMYSIFSALTDCALKHRILYFILFGVIFCAKAKPFLKYYILIYKSSVYC